jgi:endonuclease/exonuclease/phosphatase family metal-dependent hydrolase
LFHVKIKSIENQGLCIRRECRPLHSEFIRIVGWNIEKGKRWKLLEQCLDHDAIRGADILCLNEADYGMARSGNRHIAFEIAEKLGMSAVFGPSFYEFTKGVGDERESPGENTVSLQGNAVLTRFKVGNYRNISLPVCYDASRSEERRDGGRTGLLVEIETPRGRFQLVATHLEVMGTRKCRARQIAAILPELGSDAAIIVGDFNTNTFDRGSTLRTLRSLKHLLSRDIKARVTQPWKSEPLFENLRRAGFSWEEFNDDVATNIVDLASLDDKKYIPRFVVDQALKRGRHLPLRLDWIVGRGFSAMNPGHTITDLPCQPSDHLPISCDVVIKP